MAKESFGMLMVMSMKENGKMIKQTDTGYMYMSMVHAMKEIGRTIFKMELE